MSVRLHKVVYQAHMVRLDDDGNVIGELSTQEPLTLYAHQLPDLPERVEAIVKQAEAQADPPAANLPEQVAAVVAQAEAQVS